MTAFSLSRLGSDISKQEAKQKQPLTVYGRSFLSCPALSKGFESGLSDRWTYVLLMSVSHGAAPLIFCNGTSVHSGCTSPSPERSVSRALDKMEPAIANRSHGSDVNKINSTVYSVRQYYV